jgi:predicted transcriptional regulator
MLMMSTLPSTPQEMVVQARSQLGISQEKFGRQVGASQSLISKYEGGAVDPPASVLMNCIHILSGSSSQAVTEESLTSLVSERLSGRSKAALRAVVAQLIVNLTSPRPRTSSR